MVCQEEVFSWFKELSGYKRLDVICGLLNMCLPFELRFFGTCVEDLGKKDFHYLREAENRANNTVELSKLTNLTEDVTRSKLIVSLALLESSNHVCSNVIFNILTEEAKLNKLPNSDKIIDELLLLFTMALYHPAFTFDQKTLVGNQLNEMRRLFKEITPKEKSGRYNAKEIPVTVSSEPLNFKYAALTYSRSAQSGGNELSGVFVKNIELVKYQRRRVEKKEFKMQVTWLNGETSEILKTYQELHEFGQRIADVCRMDSKLQSKENNIPLLPVSKQGSKLDDNIEEMAVRVTDFIVCLPKLLPELMGCDWVVAFFQGQSVQQTTPQWTRILHTSPTHPSSSQGPTLGSVGMSTQQNTNGPNQRLPKDEHGAEVGRMKSLTIYNSQIDHSGKVVQDPRRGNLQLGLRDGNSKTARYSAPAYTTSCSSPLTSPHSSPIPSPFTSPSQSVVSSRAASPWVQRNEITENPAVTQLFNNDKLKPYKLKLKDYTFEELLFMSDEELMKLGLQPEGISHLRKTMEIIRSHPVNGLTMRSNNSSGEESSNSTSVSTLLSPSPATPTVGLPTLPTLSTQPTPVTNPSDMLPAVVHNLQYSRVPFPSGFTKPGPSY